MLIRVKKLTVLKMTDFEPKTKIDSTKKEILF